MLFASQLLHSKALRISTKLIYVSITFKFNYSLNFRLNIATGMLIVGLLKIRANEARMEVANTTINNRANGRAIYTSPTPSKQTAPRPLHGQLKFRGPG